MSSQSAIDNFETFYETWLEPQQAHLDQLLCILQINGSKEEEENQLRLVINQILEHHQRYHEEISRAAGEDVFRVLSAPWLSSYERTLLWISGFKPSIVFRFVTDDLTAEQTERVEDLKAEVRRKEGDLTEAMACLQESVAAPPIVRLARREGRLVDGEICEMEDVMDELRIGMVAVFDGADKLRGFTIKRVMEILTTNQTARLLAAATEFQLRTRRWGVRRDSQTRTTTTTTT